MAWHGHWTTPFSTISTRCLVKSTPLTLISPPVVCVSSKLLLGYYGSFLLYILRFCQFGSHSYAVITVAILVKRKISLSDVTDIIAYMWIQRNS